MSNLVTFWLLFIAPILIFALLMFGAHLYALGAQGRTPSVTVPRLGWFGRGQRNGQSTSERATVPEV